MVDKETDNPVDNPPKNLEGDGTHSKNDVVGYETHRKLLGEKKALQQKYSDAIAKNAEYEANEQARQEEILKEQGNFKDVLAKREEELELSRTENLTLKKDREDSYKLSSFLNSMGTTKIDSQYLGLIPLDEIKMDDQGQVDQESVIQVINNFKTSHPRLVIDPKVDLPNHKVGNSKGGLSYQDWKNLGSSKEMQERYHELTLNENGIPQ